MSCSYPVQTKSFIVYSQNITALHCIHHELSSDCVYVAKVLMAHVAINWEHGSDRNSDWEDSIIAVITRTVQYGIRHVKMTDSLEIC